MKKKMKPILLTFFALAVITAGGCYLLASRNSGPSDELRQRIEQDQGDLGDSRAYRFDIDKNAIPLETAGSQKNVLNFENKSVYDVRQSNIDRERLDRLIKRTDPDFEDPIIALNPFGTNENTFYFYFTTSYRCMVRYTVTVGDETISDHIRYVNNGQEGNLAKTHEFVLSGLVPGMTNYIVVELLDSTGARREGKTYKYAAPANTIPVRLRMEEGYSRETCRSGLFFVFPGKDNRIAAYDNQGILRNVTKTETAHGGRLYQQGDSVFYQVADDKVARVSPLGRVTGAVKVSGYGPIRDFSYDGYDEVYSIGRKKNRDYLLATSMQSGKTRVVYRFPGKVTLGSLSMPQSGKMFVTSAKPSGVFCMDALTGAKPRIAYVMGKKSDWKGIVGKKKIVEEKTAATWDTSRSRIVPADGGAVSLMVGRDGKATGVCGRLDGEKKEFKPLMSLDLGSNTAALVQEKEEHMILTDTAAGYYAEYDKDGKATRKFSYGGPLDSVLKLSLEDLCFYAQ